MIFLICMGVWAVSLIICLFVNAWFNWDHAETLKDILFPNYRVLRIPLVEDDRDDMYDEGVWALYWTPVCNTAIMVVYLLLFVLMIVPCLLMIIGETKWMKKVLNIRIRKQPEETGCDETSDKLI